jgi:hypothetical protein
MTAPPASPSSRSIAALLLAAGSFVFASPVAAGHLIAPAVDPAAAVPAAAAANLEDDAALASVFVPTYAAINPKRGLIARWTDAICVRVAGLASDQDGAVKARVEEVARAVGAPVASAGCAPENVEIGFSANAQGTLDDVIAHKGRLLGDGTSGTKAVKTVTRPVQAWYVTNGVEFSANAVKAPAPEADLKALVLYQGSGMVMGGGSGLGIGPGGVVTYQGSSGSPPNAFNGGIPGWGGYDQRALMNVLVIVDLSRTGAVKLGAIADYAAMLALAQPGALDRCNVLPSVTDLFAGPCAGRIAADRLTPADTAYLTALYARRGPSDRSSVVKRMAAILDSTTVASR